MAAPGKSAEGVATPRLLKEFWFWRGETISALNAQGVHIGSQMTGGRVSGVVTRIADYGHEVVIDVSPEVGSKAASRQVIVTAGGWGVVALDGEAEKLLGAV